MILPRRYTEENSQRLQAKYTEISDDAKPGNRHKQRENSRLMLPPTTVSVLRLPPDTLLNRNKTWSNVCEQSLWTPRYYTATG